MASYLTQYRTFVYFLVVMHRCEEHIKLHPTLWIWIFYNFWTVSKCWHFGGCHTLKKRYL